ncbi:hypothetical protein A9Z42_0011910 [Trichoderma parareesei]|uniref:Uncharacterized protein n=1 Tax=Trichoderma parareesei TaxID=858221 RepID=A0A2H2ZNI2_TRIPA|nr:hypothetical protein A9Z42_0011910 [Trichoderma parareesei]
MGDWAPEGEQARGGRSECRGRQRAGSATSTMFLGFAQSKRERARARAISRLQIRVLQQLASGMRVSCLVSSLTLAARRFARQDEEQAQEQLQGAGGLQSGRSKGELAARWLDRIET